MNPPSENTHWSPLGVQLLYREGSSGRPPRLLPPYVAIILRWAEKGVQWLTASCSVQFTKNLPRGVFKKGGVQS